MANSSLRYDPAGRYEVKVEDVELALFQEMPHGMAGWPEAEVARMIDRIKAFIAQRLAAAVTAS